MNPKNNSAKGNRYFSRNNLFKLRYGVKNEDFKILWDGSEK